MYVYSKPKYILYYVRGNETSLSNFPLASSPNHHAVVQGVCARDTRTNTTACQLIQFLSV